MRPSDPGLPSEVERHARLIHVGFVCAEQIAYLDFLAVLVVQGVQEVLLDSC